MSAIYEPKGKAREYSPLALNYYKGCTHECLYCYVPSMFKRFNSGYNHSDVGLGKSPIHILDEISKSAKKFKGTDKQVLLNFTSDPYNAKEKDYNLTTEVLKILRDNRIPTAILTKSGKLVLKDLELFKSFNGNIVVGQSLTFWSEKSLEWESGAAIPSERLEALKVLKDNGIKTWASFEPVIIPEESLKLLTYVCKNGLTDYVKIGKINNYKGIDKDINWNDFLNKAVSICREYNMPFYIKEDLLKFKDNNLYLKPEETEQDFLALKSWS